MESTHHFPASLGNISDPNTIRRTTSTQCHTIKMTLYTGGMFRKIGTKLFGQLVKSANAVKQHVVVEGILP